MDQVVREQIRAWKAAMDADNEVVLEIKRNRTPAERMRLLQAFLDGHGQIGLNRRKENSSAHRMPYGEIQERILARHSERISSN